VNVTTVYQYNPGVQVVTSGYGSTGVYARTSNTTSYAVYGQTSGPNSPGVIGESAQHAGIYGKGKDGGYFTTNGEGVRTTGSYPAGVNISTPFAFNIGMLVNSSGVFSKGIVVNVTTASVGIEVNSMGDVTPGIVITTEGTSSKGIDISTHSDMSEGLRADTDGSQSDGVLAITHGPNSEGVYAKAYGGTSRGVHAYSQQYDGIYTETGRTDNKWGLWTPDYIFAKGSQYPATDVAEYMPVVENATPGTVLIIGDDGRLVPAAAAYDDRVAGIVSTDPGVFLGAREGGTDGEALIAIAGRVPCNVDAGYGAIHPGDVLTTSDHPGYAMKAEKVSSGSVRFYLPGTVLGKAMGTLESGTGTIEVLVTLQ
jgi:hypothetical protein